MQELLLDEVEGPDLTYLHYPFLDPAAYVQVRAILATAPPGWTPPIRRRVPPPLPARDLAALATWEPRGFTKHERDAWLAAGLSRYDAHLAEQCVRAGLTCGDLYREVSGRRVSHWLKSGESVDSVRARLWSASA